MATKLDIIVVGATGYTGQIVCKYLNGLPETTQPKWGIAGRSEAKLTAFKEELPGKIPSFVIDINKPNTLDAMCQQATCVIACAGPFTKIGMPIVEACLRNGTHYVDTTGEFNFIRQVITRFHERARMKGVALVCACGFDSVPSDVGNYVVHKAINEPMKEVIGYFDLSTAGLSTGTVNSLAALLQNKTPQDESGTSLNPQDGPKPIATPQRRGIWYDWNDGIWTAPFMMAPTNERIVRRSNALRNSTASYVECMQGGLIGMTHTLLLATSTFMAMAIRPIRRFVMRKYFPPGQNNGPSDEQKHGSYFRCRFVGYTHTGRRVVVLLSANRQMYDVTGVFAAECAMSAVALSKGGHLSGGALTPSVAFGDDLVCRLNAAGIEIKTESYGDENNKK